MPIVLTFKDVCMVWWALREYKPTGPGNTTIHTDYCELISDALLISDFNEVLRICAEAIAFFNLKKKE